MKEVLKDAVEHLPDGHRWGQTFYNFFMKNTQRLSTKVCFQMLQALLLSYLFFNIVLVCASENLWEMGGLGGWTKSTKHPLKKC